MTDRSRDADDREHARDESRQDPEREYAEVNADTVAEDAVKFFQAGPEAPTPIQYPDDPPPADDHDD
jgi:hypothetical protein